MEYHRRSIRLKGFDYSKNGYYFVTICVQNKDKLFWNEFNNIKKGGHIGPPVQENINIGLNNIGKMIDYWWYEIPKHFKNILCDEFVIMPDHIHGILINTGISNQNFVGVDRRVDPIKIHNDPKLGKIIQWFKTMSTNNYLKEIKNNNWPKFEKRIWQRNFYERIIRNEKEYLAIKQYIKDNPKNW